MFMKVTLLCLTIFIVNAQKTGKQDDSSNTTTDAPVTEITLSAENATDSEPLTDEHEQTLFKKLNSFELQTEPLTNYFGHWQNFKKTYSKKYPHYEEEEKRFLTFVNNHQKIQKHNLEYKLGLKSFSMALNQFAHMDSAEFKKYRNGFNNKRRQAVQLKNSRSNNTFIAPQNVDLPKAVDWRRKGYVTPVKDQGNCGSCWAFSATGALEGQHFKQSKKLVSLSEQNLVDCSGPEGNDGCNGGLMDNAFEYILLNEGIDTEKSYPYKAKDGKCRYKNDTVSVGAIDRGFMDIESGNETDLEIALATVGPIAVAIDASHESFQFYDSGIYYEPDCDPENLDHGVLAVGYGASPKHKKEFWIVKNSWGTDWGSHGYIRMARNKDNNCGIATSASYPVV